MSINLEALAHIISVITMLLLAYQIRSDIKLNRYNQTFKIISDLDVILNKEENSRIIQQAKLMEDFSDRLTLDEAIAIYNESVDNQKIIYEILNFYEALSLSVSCKHIDGKILRRMYGSRIINAYEKLDPFISAIADNYKSPKRKPYQHFQELYDKWKKYYGGRQ